MTNVDEIPRGPYGPEGWFSGTNRTSHRADAPDGLVNLESMHVIGTAGHVDHGKSALVQALTGTDPDRFAEEKRRGMTIDLGFASMELPSGARLGVIDVPGHERFIRNMLAGAGSISVCLFVVAANEGWKPQSAEHLAILDLLEITHGVVAVTKADLVGEVFLQTRMNEVRAQLQGSGLAGAPIVACSARTRAGIHDLVEQMDHAIRGAPQLPDYGRPRLWIDRVFTMSGSGTVVTGTTTGGTLHTGSEVEVAPRGVRARIRGIQTHHEKVDRAEPGARAALNLSGVERTSMRRGDTIAAPGGWHATQMADVELRVANHDAVPKELTEKGAYLLYVGTAETPVRIRLLGRDALPRATTGIGQLRLRDPLPLERNDRFVIRDAGRMTTLAGGRILDPLAPPARRSDVARAEMLSRLGETDGDSAVAILVDHYEELDEQQTLFRAGGRHGAGNAGALPADTAVVKLADVLVAPRRHRALQRDAIGALEAHHASRPLEGGLAREELRASIGLTPARFAALLELSPDLVEEANMVRLESHTVVLDDNQANERERLLKELDDSGFTPPPAKELGADQQILKALERSGELVRIGDFYLTRGRADEARRKVVDHINASGPATVAQIRDLLETTRKYAVPLCEWLDSTGVTLRRGDVRLVGPSG